MRATRMIVGVLLCLVGAVWIGQGIGLIGGSFMSGEGVWAVIGIVVVAFGVLVLRGPKRRDGTDAD